MNMAEFILAIFVFIALFGLTILLFGGWLVVTIVKGIGAAASGLFSSSAACPSCREKNPSWARFCRRCGQPRGGAVRFR